MLRIRKPATLLNTLSVRLDELPSFVLFRRQTETCRSLGCRTTVRDDSNDPSGKMMRSRRALVRQGAASSSRIADPRRQF
jgi:hypothetical protein